MEQTGMITLEQGGKELELKILLSMKEKIEEYGDMAEIMHPEAMGETFDILTAEWTGFGEHNDTVTAEFIFRDTPGDTDGGRLLCSTITLRDDVPAENTPELAFAIGIMNFYIEKGSFAINKPTNLVVYRSTRFFHGDTTEDVLLRDCIREMQLSYETASRYVGAVLALAEGSLSIESFMELVRG